MKKIQMVDLQSQYQKIKNEVDEKVLNVMQSAQFINGPEVQNFQKELENIIAKYKLAILIGTSYKNIEQAINTGNSFENLEKNTELRANFKAKMNHICKKSVNK